MEVPATVPGNPVEEMKEESRANLKKHLAANCSLSQGCGKRAHFRPVVKSDEQIAYEDKLETCTTDYIGPMRHKSHGGATGAYVCTHLGSRSQSQKPKLIKPPLGG